MNYFAHGYRFLGRPYFLAGTAVPDWLSVSDRAARVRRAQAEAWCRSESRVAETAALGCPAGIGQPPAFAPAIADLSAGIVQHLEDDRRFHGSPAFFVATSHCAQAVRRCIGDRDDARPGFVGHLLTELLLDAALIERKPTLLEDYYGAMAAVDPGAVQECVNLMARVPSRRLAAFIGIFRTEQFLRCYLDDHRLLHRVNQVLRRVQLPPLPDGVCECLPDLRRFVAERCDALVSAVAQ